MDKRLIEEARKWTEWTDYRLQISIPSILAEGETFTLRASIFGPDSLPASDFRQALVVEEAVGIEGLPERLAFPADGSGRLEAEDLRALGPDCARVTLRPENCPAGVPSNPAWVVKDPPYRLYWGDIHIHTKYSNCSPWACKDPEFAYVYARDLTHLDFAAAADHLRGIHAEPERWPRLEKLVQQYDEPGRFVPILAFESSHKTGFGGDNNAYYLEKEGPHFWKDREDMKGTGPAVSLQELWDFLEATGNRFFTAPHHSGRAGKYRTFDEPVYNPANEPVFEIYSAWGSSEKRLTRYPLHAGNSDLKAYFVDAIEAGCRYGVIASSDDHTSMTGGESRNWGAPYGSQSLSGYHHMGLTAVWSRDLTREGLFEAITARRTYGTTFDRTLVDVRIGDLAAGQEGSIGTKDSLRKAREVTIRVSPETLRAARVTLVRNGEDLETQRVPVDAASVPVVTFRDETALDEVAIRDAPHHPEPFVAYYARVENQMNETQWTSPIWLDL